jgi:hypothetical protein
LLFLHPTKEDALAAAAARWSPEPRSSQDPEHSGNSVSIGSSNSNDFVYITDFMTPLFTKLAGAMARFNFKF